MIRSICCRERTNYSSRWLLGSSLALVAASLLLLARGATEHSQTLLFTAFPMALLISDPRLRRRPRILILALALMYGALLAVSRLAAAF